MASDIFDELDAPPASTAPTGDLFDEIAPDKGFLERTAEALEPSRQAMNSFLPDLGGSVARGATSEGVLMGSEGIYRGAASTISQANPLDEAKKRVQSLKDSQAQVDEMVAQGRMAQTDADAQKSQIGLDIAGAEGDIQRLSTSGTFESLAVTPEAAASRQAVAQTLEMAANEAAELRAKTREALPVSEEFQRSIVGQVAQGLGQLATLPAYAVPGLGQVMAVGQLYQEGYDDAVQSGATPEQADVAAKQYISVSAPLEILADKLLVGKALKAMKGKVTVGQATKEIAKQFAQEGSTEGAQQLWLNGVMKELSQIDPDRPLDEGVYTSVLVGGIVGSISAAGAQGAGALSRKEEVRNTIKTEAQNEIITTADAVADRTQAVAPASAEALRLKARQNAVKAGEEIDKQLDDVDKKIQEQEDKEREDALKALQESVDTQEEQFAPPIVEQAPIEEATPEVIEEVVQEAPAEQPAQDVFDEIALEPISELAPVATPEPSAVETEVVQEQPLSETPVEEIVSNEIPEQPPVQQSQETPPESAGATPDTVVPAPDIVAGSEEAVLASTEGQQDVAEFPEIKNTDKEYSAIHFDSQPMGGGGTQLRVLVNKRGRIVGAQSFVSKNRDDYGTEKIFAKDVLGKTVSQAEKIIGFKGSKTRYSVPEEKLDQYLPEGYVRQDDLYVYAPNEENLPANNEPTAVRQVPQEAVAVESVPEVVAETPAEEVAPRRVQLKVSPQSYEVVRELPQTPVEKANNEQSFEVRNERTGEISVITNADIAREIKPKSAKVKKAISKLPAAKQVKATKAVEPSTEPDPYQGTPLTDAPPLEVEDNLSLIEELSELGVFDENATTATVLQAIVDSKAAQDWQKILAKRLLALNPEMEIEAVNRPDSSWAAIFSRIPTPLMQINLARRHSGGVMPAILHETSHLATLAQIANPENLKGEAKKAYDDLVKIFAEIQSRPEFQGEYGASSVEEMVAEAFSNAGFRAKLDRIKSGNTTLWQKLVNAITRLLFNKPAAETSLLHRTIENAFTLAGAPVIESRSGTSAAMAEAGSWPSVLGNPNASDTAEAKALVEATQELSDAEVDLTPLTPDQQNLLKETDTFKPLGITAFFAREFGNIPGTDFNDRQSEAVQGLVKAARNYNPESVVPFFKYANSVIRNHMKDYSRSRKVRNKYVKQDSPVMEDDESETIVSTAPSPQDISIQENDRKRMQDVAKEALQAVMSQASERDQKILKGYASGMTLREVALEVGLSAEGVKKTLTRYREKVEKALFLRKTSIEEILDPADTETEPAIPSRRTTNEDEQSFKESTIGALEGQDIERSEPVYGDESTPEEIAEAIYAAGNVPNVLGSGMVPQQPNKGPLQDAINSYVTGNWPDDPVERRAILKDQQKQWLDRVPIVSALKKLSIQVRLLPDNERSVLRFDADPIEIGIGGIGRNAVAADPRSTEQEARTFTVYEINEELIHAFHVSYLREMWRRSDSPGTFEDYVRAYTRSTLRGIIEASMAVPVEESHKITEALASATQLYHSGQLQGRSLPEVARIFMAAPTGDQVQIIHEMIRQVVQLRQSDQITETSAQSFLKAIQKWIADALKGLRWAANNIDKFGPLFSDQVRGTEALLASAFPKDRGNVAPMAEQRSQVGGVENIGHQFETTSMKETTSKVRERIFDSTKEATEDQTSAAWDMIQALSDFVDHKANLIAGEINSRTGTDAGTAATKVELLRYAVKVAAQSGDRKMLNYLMASVNLMPNTLMGTGESDAGLFLRVRAEFESPSLTAQRDFISQSDEITSRMLADRNNNQGDIQFVKDLRERLQKMKLDAEAVADEVRKFEESKGVDISKLLEAKGYKPKDVEKSVKKGKLFPIIEAILNTPLSKQADPNWRRKAVMDYLRNTGLSEQDAESVAKILEVSINQRFREAQVKAAEQAVRNYAPWQKREKKEPKKAKSDLDKILAAVRSQALDPTKSFAEELAKQNGWTGFTADQFKRMSELDAIIEDETKNLHDKTKARDELMSIVQQAKLSPKWRDTLGDYYVGMALSGIPTMTINIVSPAAFTVQKAITDGAVAITTNPASLPGVVRNFMGSLDGWMSEVSYAYKNDSYTNDVNEALETNRALKRKLEQALKRFQDAKTPVQKAIPTLQIAVGLADYTRRALSSLDQGAITVSQQYNMGRYAMSALKKAGYSATQSNNILTGVLADKQRFYEQAVKNGLSKQDAAVAANDHARDTWDTVLSKYDIDGAQVMRAAQNDALSEVGRRGPKEEGTNDRDEDTGMLTAPIFKIINAMQKAGIESPTTQILVRMIYGFFSVPARVIHYAAWYSPYGFVRAGVHTAKARMGSNSPYNQSLATDVQMRQRLIDATAGTVVMALLWGLSKGSADVDDDEKWALVTTGNGPKKGADPAYYDAWQKKWKPWSVTMIINGTRIPMNFGRGFEPFMFPLIPAAAADDYAIRFKQNQGKESPAKLDAMSEIGGSIFAIIANRGPAAILTRGMNINPYSTGSDYAHTVMGTAASAAKTMVPVFGSSLARNISDLFTMNIDRSSANGVIAANTPFAGAWMGKPALNFLGDPINDQGFDQKLWRVGIPIVVSLPDNSPNRKLYQMIFEKGQGPIVANRAALERNLGTTLTDSQWYTYAQAYGRSMAEQMNDEYEDLQEMLPGDFNSKLNEFTNPAKDEAMETLPEVYQDILSDK